MWTKSFASLTKSINCLLWCSPQNDKLTNDSDCKGAVGLVPRAVRRNVGDGFLSNREQLGRSVDWLHLHHYLDEYETGDSVVLTLSYSGMLKYVDCTLVNRKLNSSIYNNRLIGNIIYQAKMPNFHLFQHLRCEDFLLFSVRCVKTSP